MATSGVQTIAGLGSGLVSNTASTAQSSTASSMNMNSFLQMFCTQLQYQDPTNPLESYQLAAQFGAVFNR